MAEGQKSGIHVSGFQVYFSALSSFDPNYLQKHKVQLSAMAIREESSFKIERMFKFS